MKVRAFVKAVCSDTPELERALTEACLHHPGLAAYLAQGAEVYEGAYEMDVPYVKRLGAKLS